MNLQFNRQPGGIVIVRHVWAQFGGWPRSGADVKVQMEKIVEKYYFRKMFLLTILFGDKKYFFWIMNSF
jgi:hypothetical protein